MAVDLLSDVLAMIRLTGAMVFHVDVRGPWGFASHPTPERLAPLLPDHSHHLIAFHVLLEGSCWIRHAACDWFKARAGQAVILPLGTAHDLCDQPGRRIAPFDSVLGGARLPELRHVRFGPAGDNRVSLLCGFLGCDRRAFQPLFNSLPIAFTVKLGSQLQALVHYEVRNALDDQPGAANLRVRLAELLFTESLRRYARALPAEATGWLAGLSDPLVGRALQALHAEPCRSWSVESLAKVALASRSSLASRFCELIGEPPMRYLTQLRMQRAAQRLSAGSSTVAGIADEVGYASSAAFQRAFKRSFGLPPAAWRRRAGIGA
ncbi:MAG TPA: AraC family transcriptional regulator [Rhodanobacteraceae bacterium]|nr:AraC family transcriptional regulator [Rhodanobacteraceae bacterium]